jgi:hypothetical protein
MNYKYLNRLYGRNGFLYIGIDKEHWPFIKIGKLMIAVFNRSLWSIGKDEFGYSWQLNLGQIGISYDLFIGK